jgi:hypothetical protein
LPLIVLSHPASIQETKNRAEYLRAELEMQLTGHQVEVVQARARAKDLESVVDEILKSFDTFQFRR